MKDTHKDVNLDKEKEKHIIRYVIGNHSEKRKNYYWKSRKGKDDAGNNTMHFVFMIRDEVMRYKALRILIKEEIGDLSKRNILGDLPHELVHD